jgi:polyvinyl alcohol dehydrogenase (cytochrome)
LDAKSGAILWSYNSGGVCNAGASISDGVVYWGSGRFSNPASGPQKLFAFALPHGVGDD